MSSALKIGCTTCGNTCQAMKMPRTEKTGLAASARSRSAARSGNTPPIAEAPSSGGTGSMLNTKSSRFSTSRTDASAPSAAPATGWPGGLILGALIVLGFNQVGTPIRWEIKLGVFLVPVLLYGLMMVGRTFPHSEAKTAGISMQSMMGQVGLLKIGHPPGTMSH